MTSFFKKNMKKLGIVFVFVFLLLSIFVASTFLPDSRPNKTAGLESVMMFERYDVTVRSFESDDKSDLKQIRLEIKDKNKGSLSKLRYKLTTDQNTTSKETFHRVYARDTSERDALQSGVTIHYYNTDYKLSEKYYYVIFSITEIDDRNEESTQSVQIDYRNVKETRILKTNEQFVLREKMFDQQEKTKQYKKLEEGWRASIQTNKEKVADLDKEIKSITNKEDLTIATNVRAAYVEKLENARKNFDEVQKGRLNSEALEKKYKSEFEVSLNG